MEKEKALDVIKRQIDCYSNEEDKCFAVRACGDCKYNATVEEIIEALQMAISALEKQEQDRWIPVTERLPEKEGCYMVTVKNDHERIYSKTAWYAGDGWFARQDIIAWRPLPEPYTEEDNDKP